MDVVVPSRERQLLDDGLGDQHSVERIAMAQRESAGDDGAVGRPAPADTGVAIGAATGGLNGRARVGDLMAASSYTAQTPSPKAPAQATTRWRRLRDFAGRHGRFTGALAGVVGLLVVINILRSYGPAGAGIVLGPTIAVALVVLARRWGLTWSDLGLSRRALARGAIVAAGAVAAVAVVYAVAAVLPLTRSAFLDSRYELPPGRALLTAFVLIPLGTVLLEEIAFRGVLQGLLTRHHGAAWGLVTSSALFGLWHILPSLGLIKVNPAIASIAGSGTSAQVITVLGAVGFTALAGLLLGELRRRSGSLLASSGLHFAVNGLGVIVASILGAIGTS